MTKKIYLLWHARDITCPTSTFLDRQISSLACQVCHLCLYRSSRRRIQFLAHESCNMFLLDDRLCILLGSRSRPCPCPNPASDYLHSDLLRSLLLVPALPGPPEKMPPPKLPGHTAPVLVEMPRAPPPSIHPDLQARSPRSPHFRLLIPPPA